MAQHAIGSYIYLFTRSNLRNNEYSDEVVISAHGGYKPSDAPFPVKGPELRFYSVEGAEANESGLICYVGGVKETKKQGDSCKNYRLKKFQGSHGTESGAPAQTYGSIQRDLDKSEDQIAKHAELLATASADEIKKFGLGEQNLFDVATVRNRWWHDELKLEYVIKQLLARHVYRVVHCSFCRVRM